MEPAGNGVLAEKREVSLFDLSIPKLLILAVLGLMIFGPEQLPKMAAQAGRALRDLRRMAENARSDLSDSLGPEFRDFDLNDLNPRSFVRKHLLEDLDDDEDFRWAGPSGAGLMELDSNGTAGDRSSYAGATSGFVDVHDTPPFDADAT
jgi:sec-independent protein translocase protein TatB